MSRLGTISKPAGMDVLYWGNPPPGLHNTPIYLGQDAGTFEVPEVRIKSRDNLTGADYTESLVAGLYDMGHIGTPPLFAALSRTDDYVIVGHGLVRYPPFYLMVSGEVTTLRELSGRTIALNKLNTCPHSVIKTLSRPEGMGEEELHLAPLNNGDAIVASIERGEVAGALLWEPYVSYVERVLNWKILADGRTTMNPSDYGVLIYVRRSLLAEQPHLVQSIMVAYAKSVRVAQQELDASAAALHRRMPTVSALDIEASLRREARSWSPDSVFDFQFLNNVVSELKDQRVLPKQFTLNDVVAESALISNSAIPKQFPVS